MTAPSQVEQDSQSAVGRDSGKRAFQAHPVSVGSNHDGFSLSRSGQNRVRAIVSRWQPQQATRRLRSAGDLCQ